MTMTFERSLRATSRMAWAVTIGLAASVDAFGGSAQAGGAAAPRDAASLVAEASIRAGELDLAASAQALRLAAAAGAAGAEIAELYLTGLLDAREAFRSGGAAVAMEPVRRAIESLSAIARGRPGQAEIARLTLHAAAAAAQSERDEMRLYLEAALRMEQLQLAAGEAGAPLVSAAEVAGDLWLQLYEYREARRAYLAAAQRLGTTFRLASGLARSARGLGDAAEACARYRALLDDWGARPAAPPEIADARAYVDGCVAQAP